MQLLDVETHGHLDARVNVGEHMPVAVTTRIRHASRV